MTQKNIIENNRLLAEFLGANVTIDGEYEMYGIIPTVEDGEWENHFFKPENMPFDTDWNWLMQVVERINIKDDFKYTVRIYSMDVEIHNNETGVTIVDLFSDYSTDQLILSVYEACVEFIKWYNDQNKKDMTKHYSLTESEISDFYNIGVIAITDGKADIPKVKEALESHFDAEITDVEVHEVVMGEIEVNFTIDQFGELKRETVTGYQTWLYI